MRSILFFLTLFDWAILLRHLFVGLWKGVNWKKATAGNVVKAAVLGGRSFFVLEQGQWTGRNTFALLARYGVTAYNFAPTRRGFHFEVRPQQARWAYTILVRSGCPLDPDPKFFR